jgi:hypothetical protein
VETIIKDGISQFVKGSLEIQTVFEKIGELALLLFPSGLLLYSDYRLSVYGILFCVSGYLSLGIFRAGFAIAQLPASGNHTSHASQVSRVFVTTAILTTFFITTRSALQDDSGLTLRYFRIRDLNIIAINIVSAMATFWTGLSPLVFCPVRQDVHSSPDSTSSEQWSRAGLSMAPALIAYMFETYSGSAYVSTYQVAAFLTSVVLLVEVLPLQYTGIQHPTRFPSGSAQGAETKFRGRISWGNIRGLAYVAFFLTTLLGTWLLQLGADSALNSIEHSPLPKFDTNYTASQDFDIVVSMYKEDPNLIRTLLLDLKQTHYLKNHHPRTIIYTKDPNANETLIKSLTGADTVFKLPNVGREGGTYLHHIINHWDELADKTMYVQAEVHNTREFITRVNDYLQHNTGMLSLGFSGVTCDCERCHDGYGWKDDWAMISTIYSEIYGKDCQQALLAYKGQFVVSAQRARGISKKIYQYLYDAITSDSGWAHDRLIIGDAPDIPSAPYFGFTVERLWSILFQCSDLQIAAKCPSLLSGWRTGGSVEDCQCLDFAPIGSEAKSFEEYL